MRYYQSMVDQEVLMKGEPYDHLKESYIIVILPQDPFDEQRKRYTFKTHCLESDRVDLKENTTMILLNSQGIKGEVSKRLQSFFDLMNSKMNIEDSYIKQLQESIAKYMSDPERKRKFMADINDELDWKAEGREEGIAIGLLEGQEKTIMRTILTLREDAGFSNEQIMQSLLKRFGQDYSKEQLQKLIKETK